MTLQEFTQLARSYSSTGAQKLTTAIQFAEFVLLAKRCADSQRTVEAKQWAAELASGATAYATELCDADPDLEAVHVALLSLEDEYEIGVIRSQWAEIETLLTHYVARR